MKYSIKKALKIAAVLLGIAIFLAVSRVTYNYVYHVLPPQQVNLTVSYTPSSPCRMSTPIYMLITNDSRRDIINTSFSLLVKKAIDSNSFIQLLVKKYSTDKMIKAGDSYGGCWAYPKLITDHYDPEELIYEIDAKQIVFKD